MRVEKRELHYGLDVVEFLLSRISTYETALKEIDDNLLFDPPDSNIYHIQDIIKKALEK